MTTPRYLIAKYLPDLNRGEPRNIGVVLWTIHGMAARFLAERTGRPGDIDGRSIPSFVTSAAAYKQWVEFWQEEISKTEVVPAVGGKPVSRNGPEFLSALAASSKGNFVLIEGGFLLDPIGEDDLPSVLDELFATLVDTAAMADETRDPTLDDVCEQLIGQSGIRGNPGFKSRYSVDCKITAHTKEQFEFSYGYGNGVPKRLYQRVPMPRKSNRSWLRKTVHDTAWMFEKVVNSHIVSKSEAVSLVYLPDEQKNDQDVVRSLDVLGSVSCVINLRDSNSAIRTFTELPPIGHD